MQVSEMFPSKYLKASDLKDASGRPQAYTLTISRVDRDEIEGDNGNKTVFIVYFENAEKGLVLNKTNAFSIAQLYGDHTDNWTGQPIELYPATVVMNGAATPCIRVRMASGQTVASQQQAPAQNYADRRNPPDPALQSPAPAVDFDDSIPF